MTNTDKIIDYLIDASKAGKVSAPQIKAFAQVIKALGIESPQVPNTIEANNDNNFLDEEAPIDLSQIKQVEIQGVGKKDVRIYN